MTDSTVPNGGSLTKPDNVIDLSAHRWAPYRGNGAIDALDRVLGLGQLGEAAIRVQIRDVLLGFLWLEGYKIVPLDPADAEK